MCVFQIPHCYFCLAVMLKNALLKREWPSSVIHELGSYFTPLSKLLTLAKEKMETRYGFKTALLISGNSFGSAQYSDPWMWSTTVYQKNQSLPFT